VVEIIPRQRGRDTDFCDQIIDLNKDRDGDKNIRLQ